MCPGDAQVPPVDNQNRPDGATDEPPFLQRFPGETQAPPVDNNNNNIHLPGETQMPPVDNTMTYGEAHMHSSSINSPGENQVPPVDHQSRHSDDPVSPSLFPNDIPMLNPATILTGENKDAAMPSLAMNLRHRYLQLKQPKNPKHLQLSLLHLTWQNPSPQHPIHD